MDQIDFEVDVLGLISTMELYTYLVIIFPIAIMNENEAHMARSTALPTAAENGTKSSPVIGFVKVPPLETKHSTIELKASKTTITSKALKCFCENKIGSGNEGNNGANKKNGIICEQNGRLRKYTYCADDEWCIGPTNSTNSIYQVDSLCVKGKSRRRCLKAVLSYLLNFKTNILND